MKWTKEISRVIRRRSVPSHWAIIHDPSYAYSSAENWIISAKGYEDTSVLLLCCLAAPLTMYTTLQYKTFFVFRFVT